jgi:hypothetical protein
MLSALTSVIRAKIVTKYLFFIYLFVAVLGWRFNSLRICLEFPHVFLLSPCVIYKNYDGLINHGSCRQLKTIEKVYYVETWL